MPQHQDIVFNASEEARASKHRHVESRIREKFREKESPRLMTINIPTGPPKAAAATKSRPPEEIVIGKPGETPPQTIEVKGFFCPPKEIVVIEAKEEQRQVPDVIQISDMIAAKQAAAVKSFSSTEMANVSAERKTQQKHKEQRLSESFKRSDDPASHKRSLDYSDHGKFRKELPALGDEITVIKPSESITIPQIQHRRSTSGRRPSLDPPAAKASTTSTNRLPNFSNLATSNDQRSFRHHRKNVLDGNHPLHQSWPVSANHVAVAAPRRSSRSRVPHWLGVTGKPEDWIEPDDIQQIGRKIASQRLEI